MANIFVYSLQLNPVSTTTFITTIMKSEKTRGLLFLVGGLILFFVSIYGYPLGIACNESFGAFQWTGTIIGVVAAVWGTTKLIWSRKSKV